MKYKKLVLIFGILFNFLSVNAQEKKIKFNKGTLKICSSKSFVIEGYDGDEVIIESLHEKMKSNLVTGYSVNSQEEKSKSKGSWELLPGVNFISTSSNDKKIDSTVSLNGSAKNNISYSVIGSFSENDSTSKPKTFFFNYQDSKRKEGLKKLGKKNKNYESGIYFIIEEKEGELFFRDDNESNMRMTSNREQYKIKIPNTIKLNWQSSECNNRENDTNYFYFNSEKSSLSNFDGEVAISSSIHDVRLVDVTGPVSINTIGGNVTIKFDKKTPKKLYSIYSNNGFIDIALPKNSDINVDVTASNIFSNIDFKVEKESEEAGLQRMKLNLNSGKVTMKLNANLGNIYLRNK